MPAYVLALSAGLVERGWVVDVVHPATTGMSVAVTDAGATSIAMDISHGPHRSDIGVVRALAKLLRERRPQLVHAHSTKAGLLAGIAGRLCRTASIYTPHGWAFQRDDIRAAERGAYVGLERALGRWCHRALVTVSAEERRQAVARRVGSPASAHVVHTGLRPDRPADRRAARMRLGLDDDDVAVAWVGRLGPQKRPEDLAPLAMLLAGRARILALGYGLAESPEGAALAQAGGLVVPADTDPQIVYAAADLLVQTSAWEGLSLAILEAMTAGLPVVAYAVGGVPEQVEDGRTGYLVAPSAVGALARCIERLALDADERDAMSAAARRRVADDFSYAGMIDRVEAIYSHAIQAP